LEKVTDFCEPQHTNKSFAHTYYIYLQTFLNIDIKQVLFSPGDLMSLNLNQQFFFSLPCAPLVIFLHFKPLLTLSKLKKKCIYWKISW